MSDSKNKSVTMKGELLPSEFSAELSETLMKCPTVTCPQLISLSDFLTACRGYPYTTITTLDEGSRVPLLNFHCERLLSSLAKLYPNALNPDVENLKHCVLYILAMVTEKHNLQPNEMQIVLLLHVQERSVALRVHVSSTENPLSRLTPITVEVRGAPRRQPEVKNSEWYIERKPLEALRATGVNETVLFGPDDDGIIGLYEGLTSNIFIITKSHQVQTAPPSLVLSGSLRSIVLKTCNQLGVSVIEQVPRLTDLHTAQMAFLTNAYKILVPISRINIPDANLHQVPDQIDLPNEPKAVEFLNRLRESVLHNLQMSATLIPSVDSF